ncbi:L-aspartate oxidase [Pseudoclavibacter sp. RFBJ3]|uniref:L-aspartate oxidase n=1 Tax=unclassified Pseudoclavibacter TaxID=2615177 RepID=UPI000CE778AB|nr:MULTISPECIES: L-aspartate oxidase [unclassified Pseudoclavibacter]PPF86467.1 L-aspartate oxidase [Pseudoclavibacter sp. RFBJ5]PPF95199.1 L-aspartate oxidase [Pseudoclavibacter sp. RFBJ3]PPF97634.1 L-aspartate oxidase [Pseudoclavibacter sp. RFBH5]PPG22712.1 L-aspartate oxidase [Pseudoclavibacter sp. RFBI4]
MAREAGPLRVLVIGSGIAGLTAALSACAEGHDVSVVTKSTLDDTATSHAQGGIAAVLGAGTGLGGDADDSVESHVRDTVTAGAGLGDRRAIEELCRSAEARILELIALGTRFDREPVGALSRGLEAAHSHARILHAFGDATGREIQRALSAAVRSAAAKGELRLLEHTFLADVAVRGERAVGAWLLSPEASTPRFHCADAVVLATGGTGQLFAHTSNPAVATGDGIAAAARAGAQLADLEFVQFHPTVLAGSGGALISEAVRGEGAVLLNEAGERFLLGVHPDAELAPRDIVARGIADEMARQDGRPVRLDARHLGREFLERRFPSITAHIDESGLDWSRETVPVTPAAHYLMGGVVTDLSGRTSIPGLFAAGETARTGVHGANRLASNSLLEGAVFGRRVAEAIDHDAAARFLAPAPAPVAAAADQLQCESAPAGPVQPHSRQNRTHVGQATSRDDAPAFSRGALQELMWAHAGLHRSGPALEDAKRTLDAWAEARPTEGASSSVSDREDTNLLLLARLTVAAALARTETVGAHFRSDEPPAAGAAPQPASPRALPRSLPLRQKAMAH